MWWITYAEHLHIPFEVICTTYVDVLCNRISLLLEFWALHKVHIINA